MKIQEQREVEIGRLRAHVDGLYDKLASVWEDIRSGKEKNHAQLKSLKRQIAQAKTILKERSHLS